MHELAQFGQTPLSAAAWCGHLAVVQLLLSHGAHVESTEEVRSAASCALRPILTSQSDDTSRRTGERRCTTPHCVNRRRYGDCHLHPVGPVECMCGCVGEKL